MENLRKGCKGELVTNECQLLKLAARPTYICSKISIQRESDSSGADPRFLQRDPIAQHQSAKENCRQSILNDY